MKTSLLIGLVALSLGSLNAADPAAPAPDPAENPPPRAEGRHHGFGGMAGDPRHRMGGWDRKPGETRKENAGRWARREGERAREHPLADALQLTDAQKAKARELMEAAWPKIAAIREEERARIKAVMADTFKDLRPLLTPEQQAVFDDLQKLKADKAALKPAAPAKPAPPAP